MSQLAESDSQPRKCGGGAGSQPRKCGGGAGHSLRRFETERFQEYGWQEPCESRGSRTLL
jgi:hypothetical protein